MFCHTHTDTQTPDTQTHRYTLTQTDRHFPEIVKSCSRYPNSCNCKKEKSKIFAKPIRSSILIEESNKERNMRK